MIHRKYNFLTILLLLTFLGQTTAANAMVCKMDFQSSSFRMSMDHETMNHPMSTDVTASDNTSVDSDDLNTQNYQDCCKSNANCSMSGCIAIAVPIKIEISKPILLTESAEPTEVRITVQIPLSLFRPPISS